MANLFRKHTSSLRELDLHFSNGMDVITSALMENQIHLRVLKLCEVRGSLQGLASMVTYLSSAGDLLEILKVKSNMLGRFKVNGLVASLSSSCPKLTCLDLFCGKPCSAEKLRHLTEQCPHLEDVNIDRAIVTDKLNRSVSVLVRGCNEDWAICLSHILRRGQYKKVTLKLEVEYYHPVGNLKSMLEPYEIALSASTSDTCLISLMQDLPHLKSLEVTVNDNVYSDAFLLTAIEAGFGKCLRELKSAIFEQVVSFSDKALSEFIKTCQLLDTLSIDDCGLESLKAASKLPGLCMVSLNMDQSVSKEMLEELVAGEKLKWPSTLCKGCIRTNYYDGWTCNYDEESRQWIMIDEYEEYADESESSSGAEQF
eukprot:scaffold539_cov187-Ochromonas_danica.AAC.17